MKNRASIMLFLECDLLKDGDHFQLTSYTDIEGETARVVGRVRGGLPQFWMGTMNPHAGQPNKGIHNWPGLCSFSCPTDLYSS